MNEVSGVVTLARSLDSNAANSLTITVLAEVTIKTEWVEQIKMNGW